MKSTDIFNAIGEIDDRLIEEAAPKEFRKRKTIVLKALPVAACLCVILAATFGFYQSRHDRLTPYTDFPGIVFDGMGYDGTDNLALQSSSDINPYTEDTLPETLPVFQNKCYSGGLYQNYFSEEDLQSSIKKLSEKLGENEFEFSTVKAEIDTDDPNYEENLIYNVIAESEEYRISANGHRYSISPKTEEASRRLWVYLSESFDTENMGEYKTYSVDGEWLTTVYRAYKKGSSAGENILSFNLSSAEIHYKDNGLIDFVTIDNYLDSSEKVADYKTVSVEKATEKLLLGKDVSTSTPDELIIGGRVQEEHIVKVDLIYYANNLQQLFVPSYRFYVKLINPDEGSEIENYGLFYVPAVEIDEGSGFEVMKNVFQ